MDDFFIIKEDCCFCNIRLTPKASSNRLGEIICGEESGTYLKVYITAFPQKGEANEALLLFLSKTWKIPKTSITIIKGYTDPRKMLCINLANPFIKEKIQEWWMLYKERFKTLF